MKKGIGLLLVLGMLVGAAACDYSEDETNIYGPVNRAEDITARPATFTNSVTSLAFTTFSSTTLISDDVEWYVDNFWYNGVVTDATMAYVKFTSSYSMTYSSWNDAFDSYGMLNVIAGGLGQPYNGVTTGVEFEDWNRELVFGAQNLMGVDVTRKLYANPNGSHPEHNDFLRWLEILTNNTGSPLTVNVVIGGDMGSDDATRVVATSDDDAIPEPGDDWFITKENTSIYTSSLDPIVVHLVDGSMGYSEVDNLIAAWTSSMGTLPILSFWTTGWSTTPYATSTMTQSAYTDAVLYSWTGVTLEPGETKVLMHLALLSAPNAMWYSTGTGEAIEAAKNVMQAGAEVIAGMDADELNAVVNWPAAKKNCNIQGPAGAVDAGVLVGAVNETTDATAQSYSLPDGSFGICLNAAEGDWIQIWVDGRRIKRVKATAE